MTIEKTVFLSNPFMLKHGLADHPERPLRLKTILDSVLGSSSKSHLYLNCERLATEEEISRVHGLDYVRRVFSLEGKYSEIDFETPLTPDSVRAARMAAGLGLELVDRVLSGKTESGFAIVRPPGHHSGVNTGMGFCIFNNIAIAAKEALRKGLRKILILDWDVHHGNGTQEIFYEDNRVYLMDLHQEYLFPQDTGDLHEVGKGAGLGYTMNIPLPPGCKDQDYLHIFDCLVKPFARKYRPELILVSAGFDAHLGDPHGGMEISTRGYGLLLERAKKLASELCAGRLILFLEGGYNPDALAQDVVKCLEVLEESPATDFATVDVRHEIPLLEKRISELHENILNSSLD